MKFNLKHVITFSAVFFALAGCDRDDIIIGDTYFDHSGVVLDSANLQPIDSVLITIIDTLSVSPMYTTDNAGSFCFSILGHPAPVFFMKDGYLTTTFRGDTATRFDSLTILLVRK